MITGSIDTLGNPIDNAWLEEQIRDHVVFSGEYYLGHLSFVIAKDMSWFTDDVVDLIDQYATNSFSTQLQQEATLDLKEAIVDLRQ